MPTHRHTAARCVMLCSVAGAAFYVGPLAPTPVRAQALQPVVDVCTGITLPRSAVTVVIGAVNPPIVDQIETTVNGITTVTLILDPLATIPDLNIDLSTILANAAAGDPISLQILDTDGNVVAPSDDCNLTADGITLDTEGGISIGGNQIIGLGEDGQPASAGELDAIAFGNNASTAVGAEGDAVVRRRRGVGADRDRAVGADRRAGVVAERDRVELPGGGRLAVLAEAGDLVAADRDAALGVEGDAVGGEIAIVRGGDDVAVGIEDLQADRIPRGGVGEDRAKVDVEVGDRRQRGEDERDCGDAVHRRLDLVDDRLVDRADHLGDGGAGQGYAGADVDDGLQRLGMNGRRRKRTDV